tara:strand:- start:1039 stop:1569 length:531 start_codon:yes stop_codon:yes gene_type:complete
MIRKIIFAFFIGILIGGGYALYLINNPVSPLETIVNNDSTISITYSRPFKKERKIFGKESDSALVPYGKYWRTGANKHTYIENTKEIEINGNFLPPGKYSIFSIPDENEWEVFFNNNINYLGVFRPESSGDVISIKVPVINLLNEVEQFTIDFENDSILNYISLKWNLSKVTIPFK